MLLAVVQAALAFAVVAQGIDSRITTAREVVVRTPDAWQMLWKEHSVQPVPAVDFSSSILAGVFLGSRRSSGYRVEIVSVRAEGRDAVVEYREVTPPPGAITAQMLTSPYVLVRIPRDIDRVRFRR